MSSETTSKPSVFRYQDYREYLKDFYDYQKKTNPNYSYRYFAKRAGISSPSLLRMIIHRERNIGPKILPKFIKALGLEGIEAEFFICLAEYDKQPDKKSRDIFHMRMENLRNFSKRMEISEHRKKYLSDWLYPVIREMTMFDDFSPDPLYISNKIVSSVPGSKIIAVLNDLINWKYIARNEKNQLKPEKGILFTTDSLKPSFINKYHIDFLNLISETIPDSDPAFTVMRSVTISVSTEDIVQIKKILKKAKEDIIKEVLNSRSYKNPDTVVQLNLHMLPLTKIASKSSD